MLRQGNIVEMDETHAKQYIAQGFAKLDQQAEQRQTKIIEPEKKKIESPVFPEDRIDYTVRKKRGRPRKK